MGSIPAFEVYRLHIGFKLHYTTTFNFLGGRGLNLKYGQFESSPQCAQYEAISNQNDQDEIEDLFISNLFLNPDFHISHFIMKNSTKIKNEWLKRLSSTSQIFQSNICKMLDMFEIDNNAQLYQLLYESKNKKKETKKVDHIYQIIQDDIPFNYHNGSSFHKSYGMFEAEFISLLDYILNSRWNQSFLKKHYDETKNLTSLKYYKYRMILPCEDFCSYKPIKEFIDTITN